MKQFFQKKEYLKKNFLVLFFVMFLLVFTLVVVQQRQIFTPHAATLGTAPINTAIAPPSNLTLTALDSTIRANWSASPDPSISWHVFSVWDSDNQLMATKIVGKGGNVADANGLRTGDLYTIQVQAAIQNADGTVMLSSPIQASTRTDPQSPMRNASFFENFNDSPAGDLDPNYFDVRTNETVEEPSSLEEPIAAGEHPQKRLVFNNERHFHTQLIGTEGHAGVVIRPRVPFDFTNRTGTFEFEVDLAAVQKNHGKWFVMHLSEKPLSQDQDLGDADDGRAPNTIDFSFLQERNAGNAGGYNLPTIEVNVNGNRQEVVGTQSFYTPANVRVPIVLKVSQNSAEMIVNGVSAAKITGFTLPYTVGYWNIVHRNYYTSIFFNNSINGSNGYYRPPDLITQLVHWDVVQYDGPNGSYNPVVKTYIQPGCKAVADYGHNKIHGCQPLSSHSSVTLNIPDNLSQAKSALLLFNGATSGGGSLSVNGTTLNPVFLPQAEASNGIYRLNSAVVPISALKSGANTVNFNFGDAGFPGIAQVELEVVYNEQRTIGNPMMMPMPMLNVTNQTVQIYHTPSDPNVQTGTVYLYNMGNINPTNYNATIISPDTPWLSVTTPTSGSVTSIPLGGFLIPVTFSVDSTNVSNTSDFGKVGVVRITGGNMPLLVAVEIIKDPQFPAKPCYIATSCTIPNQGPNNGFSVITTFNKSAIPDYSGVGGGSPAVTQPVTPTPVQVTQAISPTPTPGTQIPLVYSTSLNGANNVPQITTPGVGNATLTLSPDHTTATVTLTYSGLTSPATMSHIHGPADMNNSAGILIPLNITTGNTSGNFTGQISISSQILGYLTSGLLYVNVHSSNFPSGEIRGQLLPGGTTVSPTGSVGTGDANGDGHATLIDFNLWLCDFKNENGISCTTGLPKADFDSDGHVSIVDYSIWRDAFLLENSSPTPTNIPGSTSTPAPPTPTSASGLPALPAAWLPNTFQFGAFNGSVGSIPTGAPWKYAYAYLAGDANSGGWSADYGASYVSNYMTSSYNRSMIPGFVYYTIVPTANDDGGSAMLAAMRNTTTMRNYFDDFKRLMTQMKTGSGTNAIKGFVVFEPDLSGSMQQYGAVSTQMSVASSGQADVQAYPNTFAGFFQAISHIRDVYAPGVLLAKDITAWAGGTDISLRSFWSGNPSFNIITYGQTVGNYLNSLGGNYDLLAFSPQDRDCDYYSVVQGSARCWDPTNQQKPSFTMARDWLSTIQKINNKRIIMWQVPNGNRVKLSENNTNGHYQDDRPEYWLNPTNGRAHIQEWANIGFITIMWGAGVGSQSHYFDSTGDGITNPSAISTKPWWSSTNFSNSETATRSDDDGGYIFERMNSYSSQGPITLP